MFWLLLFLPIKFLWTVVLEKTLESPLDCKEIKPVNPKGNQSWLFTGMTDAEAEAPILWPPTAKSWLVRKDSDAGKEWRQEKKGTTEDKMVGWHHQLKTWVWASFRRWRRTQKPGMLQSMGSQRVRHNWPTEQQQYNLLPTIYLTYYMMSYFYCFLPWNIM